ncbi:MAG: arsenate reductase ArsC [Planctomycetota bacterium]
MTGLLFLCVANSARSQMAEGLGKQLAPAGVEVYSAGSAPSQVNPLAVAAMAEVGIDLADQRSKHVSEVPLQNIRWVITLCADEVCPPLPPGVLREHWPLRDPAAAGGSDRERLAAFRRARDEIKARLVPWFESLQGAAE